MIILPSLRVMGITSESTFSFGSLGQGIKADFCVP